MKLHVKMREPTMGRRLDRGIPIVVDATGFTIAEANQWVDEAILTRMWPPTGPEPLIMIEGTA